MKFFITLVCAMAVSLLSGQTADQAQAFINKSQVAIFKTQKEMLRQSIKVSDAGFKEAIRNQALAVQSYKNNNLKDAIALSYASRMQSIKFLQDLNKPTADYFLLSAEEKALPGIDAKVTASALSAAEEKKIDELDILDVQKLRELELNINQ